MTRDVHARQITFSKRGQRYERMSLAERLWRRVDKSAGPDGCWPWNGYRTKLGYGDLGPGAGFAHRIAFESANGPIPDGLFVCHSCDNPPCCNPAHLWVGTARDNAQDMAVKGRSARLRNERSARVKLTDVQVEEIRRRWVAGETLKAMAPEYGVNGGHLSRVVNGLRRPPEGEQELPKREPRSAKPTPPPRPPRTGPTVREAKKQAAREKREAHEAFWANAVDLYRSGLPTTEIARRIGRDEGTISRNLRARGVEMRPVGAYRPELDPEAVRRWHAEGVRASEMMRRLGVGRRRLYQIFDEFGLSRFSAGRPDLVDGESRRSSGGAP